MAGERVFSPEIETAFFDWVKRSGVKVAIFDLDDTLIPTSPLFEHKTGKFFDFCKENIDGLDIAEFKKDFKRLDDESFAAKGVSLMKWVDVIGGLSCKYDPVVLNKGLNIIAEIYVTSPEIFDGVHEMLRLFKKAGVDLGLITHAGLDWTNIKLDKLGLRRYFKHIKIIDVEKNKQKGPEHWQEIIDLFGIDPSDMIAVGDNLTGDVLAANKCRIKRLVWIPSPWHNYNKGEVPDNVVKIEGISDLIPALCQQK